MNRVFHPAIAVLRVPVHAMIVPFPIAFFTGALLTDIAYVYTLDLQWANFSAWLLAGGLVSGAVAALFGLIDFFFGRGQMAISGWVHMFGNLIVLLLALFNNLIHMRDGWPAVYPTGLVLSSLTVGIMVVTGFLGHRLAYNHVIHPTSTPPPEQDWQAPEQEWEAPDEHWEHHQEFHEEPRP